MSTLPGTGYEDLAAVCHRAYWDHTVVRLPFVSLAGGVTDVFTYWQHKVGIFPHLIVLPANVLPVVGTLSSGWSARLLAVIPTAATLYTHLDLTPPTEVTFVVRPLPGRSRR